MPKDLIRLQQSEGPYGGYYRLTEPKKNVLQGLWQFGARVLKLPYNAYQTLVGRLLSYLVINPLFRKEEKNESLILQQSKYPDPLFTTQDQMDVINVVPKKNIIIRSLINWHNFFVNHTTTAKIASSLLSKLLNFLPNGSKTINKYLDKLVDQIAEKTIPGNKESLQVDQIHFRGIEQLTREQQDYLYQKLEERLHYDFRQNRKKIYFYTLQTTDNAVLDSVEVRNPGAMDQEYSSRRFLVAAMPRSNNFVDWLKHYQIYARELNATVIGFNYRGVGLSKGIVTGGEDLYADAYAQVQRLLKLGVKPENIGLVGECLGGNVAAHTAGTLHKEGEAVKLYDARSFRSLTSIIEARNKPKKTASLWNPLTWTQWLWYGIIKSIISPIIRSAKWSLDVEKEFLAIPPQDRDFLVVRSATNDSKQRFADDKMVPHKSASIYSLVKKHRKTLLTKQQEDPGHITKIEQQWIADHPRKHKFHVSEKEHKEARKANGHTVHPRLLVETYPDAVDKAANGREYLFKFFRRVWDKNESEQVALKTHSAQ
jgi:effector protein SdbA